MKPWLFITMITGSPMKSDTTGVSLMNAGSPVKSYTQGISLVAVVLNEENRYV